jgi:hypothetical protein
MSETTFYFIDGEVSYLEGFDAAKLTAIDDYVSNFVPGSYWDKYRVIPQGWCGSESNRFKPISWNGNNSKSSEEKRLAGLRISWKNDDRRKAASSRMKETRKTMKQNYSFERNAKVSEGMKKVWEKRKLERDSKTKEKFNG